MSKEKANGEPFWRQKRLDQMTGDEWESLCDGCARCCLYKTEDEDTGDVEYTATACEFLDPDTCRCSDYANRHTEQPTCAVLSPDTLGAAAEWLPETCAYRRLHRGQDLPPWHPLITGDPHSPREAGVSLHGRVWHA